MENIYKPDIRERVLERGLLYPTDEELVMLILGSGTKKDNVIQLSEKVVNIVDTTRHENLVSELVKLNGIGKCKALSIAAAVEFGRRRNSHLQAKIRCPSDIIPYLQNYAIKSQEHFVTVCLSGAHEILTINVTSVGTLNKTLIHPREIFSDAIKQKAAAIIICHNHPSGNCNPSSDDIETTKKIMDASKIIGIPLLDHIIINQSSYFSFVENNIMSFSNNSSRISW